MDYSAKRKGKKSYHGGIDMPAPFGTPIYAAANGTVVGKFLGENNLRGIEIVLRHSPQDTGLDIFSVHTFLRNAITRGGATSPHGGISWSNGKYWNKHQNWKAE